MVAVSRPELGLSVEVIDSFAGLVALESDYEALLGRTQQGLPFALHDWHVAWWSHLAKDTPNLRDALRVHVVRDVGGTCVGLVPLVATERAIAPLGAGLPALHVRSLSLLGADPYLTELRAPLVDPAWGASVAWAVARALEDDGSWDWIHWSGIDHPASFGEALAVAQDLRWGEAAPDYVLDLAESWPALRARCGRNVRESIRHGYNALAREGRKLDFEVVQAKELVPGAVDVFLRLHGLRAALAGTVPHPHRFGFPAARAFLHDVVARFARRGRACVFLLRVDGEVVAARLGFVVGRSLYLYYSGFDPAFARYGVMTTTVVEAIKWAIDRGLASVNLSAGRDVSKTRWGAREVRYAEAIAARPRLSSRAALGAFQRASTLPAAAAALSALLPKRAWT